MRRRVKNRPPVEVVQPVSGQKEKFEQEAVQISLFLHSFLGRFNDQRFGNGRYINFLGNDLESFE